MKKVKLILLFSCIILLAKSQNHLIGVGLGISNFEPPIYINYQFSYKLLNTKIKASLLPFGLWTSTMSSSYDLYLGIKTPENKRNIFYFNTGVSLYTDITVDESYMRQQVNPIIDFGYALSLKKTHHITLDISFSKLNYSLYNKYGKRSIAFYPVYILEIGYAYRFKKRIKEVKTTN